MSKPKRRYHKITPRTVAQHATQELISGNATAAVRELEQIPDRTDGANQQRAHRIVKKRNDQNIQQFLDQSLEQIGERAVERVGELVDSRDERIATKNAHYVIDHLRGKAVQKSITLTGKLNIQNVLD